MSRQYGSFDRKRDLKMRDSFRRLRPRRQIVDDRTKIYVEIEFGDKFSLSVKLIDSGRSELLFHLDVRNLSSKKPGTCKDKRTKFV